ncbi:uncharacterized protein LOC107608906 [Arachis ipaensis]|uniref:uncharacterized protein LOC107608906 n=1 Tax=Arachis ipaensis TaxID=130454 RepID=UPI0007AF0F68|nr:uncharacterized protein LOC107608906 [Arachis ipaensis]XP_025628408.1 uncharacterized protein LOC112721572 [Arachis hypogaea]
MQKYGIIHKVATAYHPQMNGQAKLVYDKACHLPVEIEHKAYWAFKEYNMGLQKADLERKLQLEHLECLRLRLLSRKLRSRWDGLYIIDKVDPYGVVHLRHLKLYHHTDPKSDKEVEIFFLKDPPGACK